MPDAFPNPAAARRERLGPGIWFLCGEIYGSWWSYPGLCCGHMAFLELLPCLLDPLLCIEYVELVRASQFYGKQILPSILCTMYQR